MVKVVIAGKNELAVSGLLCALRKFRPDELAVIGSATSASETAEGPNFLELARSSGVETITLEQAQNLVGICFLSLEYDRLLRPELFGSARLVNLHLSMLPAFRGVATSYWPIVTGCLKAGVSLHEIDSGVDTGPLIAQKSFPIGPNWTSWDLHKALLFHGELLLFEHFDALVSGSYQGTPQPEGGSYFDRKSKDFSSRELDHYLNWESFDRNYRAMSFPKFQLPTLAGRTVVRAVKISEISRLEAGTMQNTSKGSALLYLSDAVVAVDFDQRG